MGRLKPPDCKSYYTVKVIKAVVSNKKVDIWINGKYNPETDPHMVKCFVKDAQVIQDGNETSLQKMDTGKTVYPYRGKMNLHPYLIPTYKLLQDRSQTCM